MAVKPFVLTMGDPAGIGPEICAKLLARDNLPARPVVIGDRIVMAAECAKAGLALQLLSDITESSPEAGVLELLAVGQVAPFRVGEVSATCGRASFDYIRTAIDLAVKGRTAGIITAPVHKEALAAAGVPYPGHTEMLADLGAPDGETHDVAMMLANDALAVVLVSIHVSLREAIERVTVAAVSRAIRFADQGARALGHGQPRIAVAGLNPHAGEGGLFGTEDAEIIAPAVEQMREEGFDVSGPFAPDTVFMSARQGESDIVVAQYHDQGLIPIKYMGLDGGVNVTLGLPFVRTSPDHGTAFDIAGRGIADENSLYAALLQAVRLAEE